MRFCFWLVCVLMSFAMSAKGQELTILRGPYRLSVGPEVYHLKRLKATGAKQTGVLGGIQVDFERWRPKAIYWGVQYSWAGGRLNGHKANGAKLASRLTETLIEGRFGQRSAINIAAINVSLANTAERSCVHEAHFDLWMYTKQSHIHKSKLTPT